MAAPTRRYALLLATAPFSVTIVAPSGLTDILQFSAGCHGLDCLLISDITVTAGACTISYSNSVFFLNDSVTAATIATFGTAPIGAIIAWHKTFAGTPALPVNWVECNGQILVNPLSVYNGLTIPDMNSTNKYFIRGGLVSGGTQAEGTKVNGLAVSNESAHTHAVDHDHASFNSGNENAALSHPITDPGHFHACIEASTTAASKIIAAGTVRGNNLSGTTDTKTTGISIANHPNHVHAVDVPAYTGSSGAGSAHAHALTGDAETRPANITMVWIMRIY